MKCCIREIRQEELNLLENFLYEAVFIPKGVEKPPRSILASADLQIYIEHFSQKKDDHCFVAEVDGMLVGAVWVRIMKDYGHVDDKTPSLAIALYEEYRGRGLGTKLMKTMLSHIRGLGYPKISLSVQKENKAFQLYQKLGFVIMEEKEEEVIMVYDLKNRK